MADKSREQFEAWYQADIVNWSLRFERNNDSGKTYMFSGTQKAWVAWQASRATLVSNEAKPVRESGSNIGHGHVFPRADGVIARCGGPEMCRDCRSDAMNKAAQEAALISDDLLRSADSNSQTDAL